MKIRLVESNDEIAAKIARAIARELNPAIRLACPAIRRRIALECDQLIQATPEYSSLLHGELLGELGIPDVQAKIVEILTAVRDGVSVSPEPIRASRGVISGGLTIGILKSGYEDLLSLGGASYVSAPSGEEIRWLDWLLVQGDRVVVAGYDAFFDLSPGETRRSRTGMALMRRGAGWSVPGEFAGTEESNFLTRAFDVAGVEALMARICHEEIGSRLR